MKDQTSLSKALRVLDRLVETVLFVLVVAMIIIGTMQVIWRYVLKNSLSWSEESMRFMYVWVTMLGITLGLRRKQFTAIDAVANVLTKKIPALEKVLFFFTIAMEIIFFVILTIYGSQFAMANMAAKSTAMRVSMGAMYLAFPISGMLGIIYALITVYDTLKPKEQGGEVQK